MNERLLRRIYMDSAIPYQRESQKINTKKKNSFFQEIRKNQLLYLLTLPGILLIFIFAYLPIFGIVIAFQDFRPIEGVFGSPFVGFENFRFFFESTEIYRVVF